MRILISLISAFLAMFPALGHAHQIDMEIVKQIESSGDPDAFNKRSQARGLYQITPICLKHFNQATGGIIIVKEIPHKDFWFDADLRIQEYDSPYVLVDRIPVSLDDLFDPEINKQVADWYFGWLYDRTWTVRDTLIAYNWGIGNWRKWVRQSEQLGIYVPLPKETENYLKKYEALGGVL